MYYSKTKPNNFYDKTLENCEYTLGYIGFFVRLLSILRNDITLFTKIKNLR